MINYSEALKLRLSWINQNRLKFLERDLKNKLDKNEFEVRFDLEKDGSYNLNDFNILKEYLISLNYYVEPYNNENGVGLKIYLI